MALEAEERARRLSPLERDMLLDFAGLETGKVCAGGAMWEIVKDFCRSDLMTGWPQASLTPFGRRVAEIAYAQRTVSLQVPAEKDKP